MVDLERLWHFLPLGYLLTVAVELPVLAVGLHARHHWPRRLAAGLWLTACTYPVVVLVLPVLLAARPWHVYLLVAEVFAPAAECTLFVAAIGWGGTRGATWRDLGVIVVANLLSCLFGMLVLMGPQLAWQELTGG